jgi:phosphosulfolactate synthase (CoM biosynthesis protein A)
MAMKDSERFFGFLDLASRGAKPRKRGLTCIGDEGDPVPWVRSMLEIWGDYVDSVKFVPALLMMPARVVEERVKLYRDFGLSVALDDPIFAIAYYQGKAEQLLKSAWDMGFTHCQIDTHQFKLDDPERMKRADQDQIKFSNLARQIGFKLWGEVGQKHEQGDTARAGKGELNLTGIVAEMKELLESGCEHVFLENRVMRDAIGDYGEKLGGDRQLRQIVEQVGQQHIYIEIANQMTFESRNCHRLWAVRTFGPDVNFAGGTTLKEVRYVEAIRRGIIFVPGPSKSSSRLWVKSLAQNNGKAADDWWTEAYPIDESVAEKLN